MIIEHIPDALLVAALIVIAIPLIRGYRDGSKE
jgi:hypothetical protein